MPTARESAGPPISLDYLANPDPTAFVPDADAFSASLEANMPMTQCSAFQLDGAFAPLLNNMPGDGFVDGLWPSDHFPTEASPAQTEKSLTRRDYSKMAHECDDFAAWQLADPSTKVGFTLIALKNFHVAFARHNCTSYLHRCLYKDDMPRWVLHAFSTCLLYTHQTESNRGPVLRSIRMFDGDIALGQQADNDMPLLESWTRDLCRARDNITGLPSSAERDIRAEPPECWERWVFAESLRRTCMMSFSLQSFWGLIKGRIIAPESDKWAYVPRWTLSSHLWNATNSFDFFRAWKEKPLWLVSAFEFEEFLETGVGDDLDDFPLFFLTLYFGVNEMKTFCYETSGRLLT
ncbi:Uu.00g038630.m01.CDS01 [Anthostomella pinea]|uniref:Uu.00g038630.m01.CDS01 n=1 Tax=Anthostomella pinea TaxID=933095 RepID=A0AAI8VAU7_9PEZI|nr:Uu.00g038630.m01.CDS01 [Anthostomella pinea]